MSTKNTAKAKKAPVNILAIDAVSDCADGHEFELVGLDGTTGTGVILIVQGKHSDEVSTWINGNVNKATMEAALARKTGKEPKVKTMEEMRAANIEGASIRAIGWKNVTQEFSRETLQKALARNPHWIEQIVRESDDLGNFMKKNSASSSSTPDTNSD
jgi:hypothetical protein